MPNEERPARPFDVLSPDEPAMPTHQVWDDEKSDVGWICGGLTARQYAAIHLRVPDSGEDWLDRMIRQARRMDVIEKNAAAIIGWPADVAEKSQLLADD